MRRVRALSSQIVIAAAEVAEVRLSRHTNEHPPRDRRNMDDGSSTISTAMPRRRASLVMICAYGLRFVSGAGPVNSFSLKEFLVLIAKVATRSNLSFS